MKKLDTKQQIGIVIITLLILSILSLLLYACVRKKPEEVVVNPYFQENHEIPSVNGIEIIHSYPPAGSVRRPGEIRDIKMIIIHETDNRKTSADAESHSIFLTTNDQDITSWHYTVDDHSIYHSIPDNEIAWNAGDNRTKDGGNMNGIAIEMCVNIGNDFSLTVDNTAHLVAALLHSYDLHVEDVRLHRDFSGKICPHRLITEDKVEEFYQKVQQYYDETIEEPTE